MKKRHQKRSKRQRKGTGFPFKKRNTARQYFSLPPKDQETWDSIGHVVSRIREGVTLPKAAIEFGLAPKTVLTLGRSALRRQKNGRYVAKKIDQLLRVVTALTVKKGKEVIATRDSRQASLVGGHWAAVQRYLQTGDDSALLRFKGKRVVDTDGNRHLLLTDLKELDRQAAAGVLSFESMYAGGAR